MKKLLVIVVLITLYFNIGWAMGTYAFDHSCAKQPITRLERVFSEPGYRDCRILYVDMKFANRTDEIQRARKSMQVAYLLVWPVPVLIKTVAFLGEIIFKLASFLFWAVTFICVLVFKAVTFICVLVFKAVSVILWFILGGLAQLLGFS